MPIYLLTRTDDCGYDEYDAKVIRAQTEVAARLIANEHAGDEGTIWDSATVKCEIVEADGQPGVILESFNAG